MSSESCHYEVKPLPSEFCAKCSSNGCYPWNRNPLLLCNLMGGLHPAIFVEAESGERQCLNFKLVDEEMWQSHVNDLKREAELNEKVRRKAMDGEVHSSELLPAEFLAMKRELDVISCKFCGRTLALVKKDVRKAEGEIWCPFCEAEKSVSISKFKKDYAYGEPVGVLKVE